MFIPNTRALALAFFAFFFTIFRFPGLTTFDLNGHHPWIDQGQEMTDFQSCKLHLLAIG
jgi:hypothetical protein